MDSIPSETQAVVDNYNLLLSDLDTSLDYWDESCENKVSANAAVENLKYQSKLKINKFNTKVSNNLLKDGSFHPDNAGMGVKHFGFSKNTLINWAKEADLKFEHYIINSIDKNEKKYQQFCAVFQ